MLLPTFRLVLLVEALHTEVVCALHTPQNSVWDATLGTFHSDEATEIPQELVLSGVVEMLPELFD